MTIGRNDVFVTKDSVQRKSDGNESRQSVVWKLVCSVNSKTHAKNCTSRKTKLERHVTVDVTRLPRNGMETMIHSLTDCDFP